MAARGDFYELLGVRRDASLAEIRRAYEVELNRAHRAGAIRHAEDLVAAYDALSTPGRRAVYDRHGLMPVRERSPGAAPPPTPWRISQHDDRSVQRPHRRWRTPVLSIFCLGLFVGVLLTALVLSHDNRMHGRPPVPGQAVGVGALAVVGQPPRSA